MRKLVGFDRLDGRVAALIFFFAILLGFVSPWWSFVVAAGLFSAWRTWDLSQRSPGTKVHVSRRDALAPGALIALAWIVVAFVKDMIEGGRISSRLAQIFQLPAGIFIYLILFAATLGLAYLAGFVGRLWVRILVEGKAED